MPITTADFVDLAGTYYRGNKGRDTPCVILIHKFGSDRTKSGLDDLAKALNAEGFAVLTFDLRGHGQSTNVSPGFWTSAAGPFNLRGIMGGSCAADDDFVHQIQTELSSLAGERRGGRPTVLRDQE